MPIHPFIIIHTMPMASHETQDLCSLLFSIQGSIILSLTNSIHHTCCNDRWKNTTDFPGENLRSKANMCPMDSFSIASSNLIVLFQPTWRNPKPQIPGEFLQNMVSGSDTTRDQSFDVSIKPYKTQLSSQIKQRSIGKERQVSSLSFYRQIQKWCFPESCSGPHQTSTIKHSPTWFPSRFQFG